MEPLGQKLREARESQNISLEQVARDTRISKHHLQALEDEDFTAIPGETYVIGFLRNYGEYLSLNPDEIVTLYKNMKIQEQPLPMNELLEGPKRRAVSTRVFLILLVLILLGTGGFLLYRLAISTKGREETTTPSASPSGSPKEYSLQEEVLARWFELEDVIMVPLNGESYPLKLVSIGESLIIEVPGGTVELAIGEERQLDLNKDAKEDLRLLVNDLDPTASIKRANIGLYKITRVSKSEAVASEDLQEKEEGGEVERAESEPGGHGGPESRAPEAASANTILTAESPSPFRVGINFRGYCLFRYLLKGKEREERFFHKGESFSLDVKDEVMLWISNAGSLRVMVSGREVELGKSGEVAVRLIRWTRNEETGAYSLEVAKVD